MRMLPPDVTRIHFIGIGGIGMSGIAEILHALGYQVQGSDTSENANVIRLKDKGIKVFLGQSADHVVGADVVVFSSAIPHSNPEYQAALDQRIPIIQRAEMLRELMRFKSCIAVSGTHGKTTTTSLIAQLLVTAGLDPTVVNGGIINSHGSNAYHGQGDWIVVEADESDGSFTKLLPTIGVITNIDPEHMEHYKTFDRVLEAYKTFIEHIPFYGFVVLNADHPNVRKVFPLGRRTITYGSTKNADIRGDHFEAKEDGIHFDVHFLESKDTWRNIHLPMWGAHNFSNALAVIAVAHGLGLPEHVIRSSFKDFQGVKRRFTLTGEVDGISIIDDYAHHPVEIKATLSAARQRTHNKVIAVIQPHRYTRLRTLFDDFSTCFDDADSIVVLPVYSAGEDPIEGITHEALCYALKTKGHYKNVYKINDPKDLANQLKDIASAGDFVICMGAGNITTIAHELPQQLKDLGAHAS